MKKTLVLGASLNPERYSNIAIHKLREKKHDVNAVGLKSGKVLDVEIDTEKKVYNNIDTVTLYLNPKRQEEYYSYVSDLNPNRVIFNPGTENIEFERMLNQKGIKTEVACTLVLLSTNQY